MMLGLAVPWFALSTAVAVGVTAVAVLRPVFLDATGASEPSQLLISTAFESESTVDAIQLTPRSGLAFTGFAVRQGWIDIDGEEGRTAAVHFVSDGYFDVLAPGRPFVAGHGRLEDGTVVLSEHAWRRWFRSGDVVGVTVRVNGTPLVIGGVAPSGVRGADPLNPAAVFASLRTAHLLGVAPPNPRVRWLRLIARDVTRARATSLEWDRAVHELQQGDSAVVPFRPLRDIVFRGDAGTQLLTTASLLSVVAVLIVGVSLLTYALWVLSWVEYRVPDYILRSALGGGRLALVVHLLKQTLGVVGPAVLTGNVGALWVGDGLNAMSAFGALPVPIQEPVRNSVCGHNMRSVHAQEVEIHL